MTLRHMKIFLAICENGNNTTRTAEAIHMTQPAVSLAIRELEQYYGIKLFDRIGRRLKITEAGQQFMEYAESISSTFDDMEKSMKNWETFGLLRVGASITIGSQFLPEYVKEFRERCPGTEVKALIAPTDQLEQKILNNELDIALIEGNAHSPSIIMEQYMEDELVVVCSVDSEFTRGQSLTIDEFKRQNFLLREPGSGTREVFDRATEAAGFTITPIWESTSTEALINGVINGLGVAVLPYRMVLDSLARGVMIVVNVEGLDFRRRFKIIYHKEKHLTNSAKRFLELCQKEK